MRYTFAVQTLCTMHHTNTSRHTYIQPFVNTRVSDYFTLYSFLPFGIQ